MLVLCSVCSNKYFYAYTILVCGFARQSMSVIVNAVTSDRSVALMHHLSQSKLMKTFPFMGLELMMVGTRATSELVPRPSEASQV